jgi:hypothetical protein
MYMHMDDTLRNIGFNKTTSYRFCEPIMKMLFVMLQKRSGGAALSVARGAGGREESTKDVKEALRCVPLNHSCPGCGETLFIFHHRVAHTA